MRKGILGAMGWLLAALLLPMGVMAQTAKEKVRITAGVFDSYDNTFVRDEYGVPKNQRIHEKGGELWVKVKDSANFIPAASFNQEVKVGTELIFKVKLAEGELGDRGKMLDFGVSSKWWEVLEWRVNGEVRSKGENELTYIAKAGTKSVHVGVRFQRRQFQVKVVYYRLRGGGLLYSANGGSWNPLSNESPKTLNRNSRLQFKAQAFDVADFSLNGVTYGRFLALSDMGSYDMSQGDLWIEVSYSDAATSRRYIQTLCQGDGEKERFQINTLPLVGTSTDKSHYPIAGVATGKEAKVRPLGIQPSDLCLAPDRFVILAKPKRGSRLAYITIDNAVVHDTIFTVPDNEPRTVVGYFVKEGKQILMLSEVGKGAHIKVVRGNTELRAGAEVLPGDRLVVDVTDRSTVKSLRINGRRFAPGDEWLVQGSGDVLVELITESKNKFNGGLANAPLLQCEVIGGGSVKATATMKNGTLGEFTSGQLLYADSTWGGTPLYCDQITLTPKPQDGYRCVKFEVNGEEKGSGGGIHQVKGKDVYVRAIFVKEGERTALVVHTEGATGYVDVIDAATGQRLEEGTILKEGQRLRIQARGSSSEGARVTKISVNRTPYMANGAVSWAKEVTVSADDAKNDAFRVGATFEKATIQPPTPGTQPVLHIVRGKGLEDKEFIVDQCGEWGALGDIHPILNGRSKNNEESYYIAVATSKVPNPTSTKAIDYTWIKDSATYKITVVSYAANGELVQVPCMGKSGASGLIYNFYWGNRKGVKVNWSKDVYVYIRKENEDRVSATMEQYLSGNKGLANDKGLLVKYDQVREVSWKEDGDSWKGFVPKSGTLTFEAKRGWLTDCSLVSVTINDSLVAGEAGKVVPRGVKLGEWKVPEDAKDGDVRIVTVWRKNDKERVLTYAKIGKGAIDSVMVSGVKIKNGAVLKTETSLKVCTTPDAGYRLAGIRVNGRFDPLAKVEAKKQTVRIPASGDVFVEAVFVKKDTHTLRISVIGEPKPMGEVEVIRGAERLATGAEVKGEDVLAITARPAAGKRLVMLRVNGELFPNGNCYIVPSDRDVVVEATFVQENGYALFVEQEGEGEVVVERKSAAQGVWSEIYSGDAINSTDEIRVKATAATDYKLQALFVNQRNQHGAESGKYTEGMVVGQGNIYVRAIFKKASDTERRLYIVTTPGGYVKVATLEGKELRDGDTIDVSVRDLTVSSYAFPGNRAVLLQVNWVNHKSGESYSVPQEGNVFVEARFVPTHRIALAIEVQNSALGGDVVVTDAETGARLDNGALLQEGQTIRVEVTGIGQAAELPVPEVSGPAHRQSSGTNTWVVEGKDGVVYVRVAFAKEYYTVRFLAGEHGSGTMDVQRVPVGIKTKLHLNQFTAKGYRFDGWKANDTIYPDGETVLNLAGKDGTAELTAQWKAIYKVTFMLNGGEMYLPENPMVVDAGTSLNLKDDYIPHRSGYTFAGWFHEKNFANRVESPFEVNEKDVTLYARWETTGSNAVNVTFNLDGGQYLGSTENVVISVEKGKSVEKLKPNPTREGYSFEGWYQTGEKSPYDFSSKKVTEDITLTAKWEKIVEFTVTFDANGGRPSVESQRVKKDGFASMPVVTRDGWELRGWYDGGKKYEFSEKVTSDLALKAEWSPKVIFNEGVKVTDENARELSSGDTVRCGSSISVRVHAPQGKRIKSVTIGGSVKPVNAKSFSMDNWEVSRPTTIYAEWEECKEYTVTFDSQGGTAVASQRVEEGKTAIKPADPTKANCVFMWWYQKDENTKYEFDTPVTKDDTLTARWNCNTTVTEHTVTFDADGGTLSNGQSILEVKVDHGMRAPKPADPKKANYKFTGWLLNGKEYKFTEEVKEDITLVAQWEPELVCTVTFDANGGTLDNGESTKTVKVAKNGKVTKPTNDPQKAGYDFKGWFLGTEEYKFTEEVTKDITLVAQWEKKSATADEFTVTFNADGGKLSDGKEIREVPVAKDGKVTKPVDPEKPGYDFVGWNLGNDPYDFNTPVTKKIELVAVWKEKQGVLQYTVTFDANGGTLSSGGASQKENIAKNEKVKKPTDPEKQGFEFKGWFYNGEPYNFALPVTEDITLVAQWAVKSGKVEFTVTFDAAGGKFGDGKTQREVQVADGEKVTKPADPEKPEYDFVEWQLDGAAYDFSQPVNGDITLKAEWKKSNVETEYTVTFDSDGGTPVTPQVVKKGEKVHEPADPKKANYDFDGWYLKKAPYDFNTPVTEDITLVAQWKEKSGKQEFTVTFDFDNGTPVATQIVEKGGTATEPPAKPTKANYDFVEWQLNGKNYEFNTPVTENITLVAKWKKSGKEEFTVSFDSDGGTPVASQKVEKDKYAKEPDPAPAKAGYTFVEWQLNGTKYEFSTTQVARDITLKAKWDKKPGGKQEYTVTFDSKGGTAVPSQTVEEGKNATKPAEPTKTGYTFVEWQLRGVRYDFTETVTGNITLVAEWKRAVGVAITVVDGPNNGVEGATVTIVDGDGAEHKEDTDGDGKAVVSGVPVPTDGTVTVRAKIDGKDTVVTVPVEVDEDGKADPDKIDFKNINIKKVTLTVVDAKSGSGIEGATVTVGTQEPKTNGKGEAMLNLIAGKDGYPVLATATGYADGKAKVSVDGNGKATPDTIWLTAVKEVTIKVTNGVDPVKDATVTIVDGNGKQHEKKTDTNGEATVPSVPVPTEGTVTVKATIGTEDKIVTVPVKVDKDGKADPSEVDFGDGKIKDVKVTVVEWKSGRGIEGATVTVGAQKAETNDKGEAMLSLVAEKDGYPVLARADGYADGKAKVSVDVNGAADPDTIRLKAAKDVTIKVKDGNSPVEGATVTIVDEDGNPQEPATTDHDGNAIVPKVPVPTKGTVTVKAKIDGKDTVVTVPVEVDQNGDATPNEIDLKDGRFKGVSLTVADAKTGNGIEDAIVKVGTQEAKTKDEGKVTLNLMVGKKGYPVLAKAAGYADGEVVVSVNDKGIADPDTIWLTVVKDVKITVKNGKDPVKDAIVTIVDGNGDPHVATTDAGGNTTVPDVPAPTDGTVTVKKIEGNDTTVVTVPVKVDKEGKADPSEIDFKSAKPVGLTVVDSVENVGIDGATVTVGAQTAKTKVDGKVTLNLVVGKDGYTVLAKATGYADGKVKVSVDADGKATPNEIKLKPVKDVTIKVTNGTDPVKGADVTIVDGNGNPYKAKTDDDGNAKVEDVPVPIEKNGTVTVEKGEKKVTVPVTVDKDGIADPAAIDLDDKNIKEVKVTVADAKTRLRIKDATVTVGAQRDSTDGDGEVRLNLWGIDGIQYRVVAQAEGYVDSTVMRKVEKDGNDKPFLDTIWLTPLAAPYLNVFVVDQDLKPIDSVVVKIFSGTDSITQDTTKTEGWVKMELTAKRTYTIAVKKDGYNKPEPVEVFLETRGLDFTFVLQKEVQNNGNTTPVESELLAGVELYPNPASVATVLHGVENAKRIAVYTLTGVQVMSQAVHGEKELSLQVESLTEGVYVVVVESANGERKALKLVVRR